MVNFSTPKLIQSGLLPRAAGLGKGFHQSVCDIKAVHDVVFFRQLFIYIYIYILKKAPTWAMTLAVLFISCCLSDCECYWRCPQIDVVNGLLQSPIVTAEQGEAPLPVGVCELWWTATHLADRHRMCTKLLKIDYTVIVGCDQDLNNAWKIILSMKVINLS